MRSLLIAAQLLADGATRAAALHAVAEILDGLSAWDTVDPVALGDADADVCRAWALNAQLLVAAAGSGFAGPLRDAAVELRAAARDQVAGVDDGVNPLLPEPPA